MGEISPELLSAYLDDELDDEDRRRVEAALASSPGLRSELEELRAADEAVRHAMDAAFADRPIPEALQALLSEGTSAGRDRQRPGAPAAVLHRWLAVLSRPGAGVMAMARPALAAAALLLIGVAIGVLLNSRFNLGPGEEGRGDGVRLALDAAEDSMMLAVALERVPSGARHRLDASGKAWVEPVMTFRSTRGAWCREFRLAADEGTGTTRQVGIACRETAQRPAWRLVALAPVEKTAALVRETPPGAFRPAADPSLPAALGGQLTKMIEGRPLDSMRERELIARGWPRVMDGSRSE